MNQKLKKLAGRYRKLALLLLMAMNTYTLRAQLYTGVFQTVTGNTNYHLFTRVGGGAAAYINQVDLTHPILRLSSGTATANSLVKFTVENNGNVGIGTLTPAEKLSVNGNIRAKEIKVETANWPDYVFAKDYQLQPLTEVEAFINKNQHLPGLPNKEAVAAEGVNLGEMNRKLLEKVEELTLHIIRLEKELHAVTKTNQTH